MKTERLWPPAVLRLTGQGLRRAWPAFLIAWLLLTAISIASFYLRRPFEAAWGPYGHYVTRAVSQLAVTAVVSASLVAWLIHRLQPDALGGSSPWRLVPRGWAASVLSNLLIQAPSLIGIGMLIGVSTENREPVLNVVVPGQTILTWLVTMLFGFSPGESVTRRLGPIRALGASVRLTRGNRFAVMVLVILLSMLMFAATWVFHAILRPDTGFTNGQMLQVHAAQSLLGVLSLVLLTGVYLELRRIQRAGEPDSISEAFG